MDSSDCLGCRERDARIAERDKRLAERDRCISELEQRVAALEARLSTNSTNSSLPPSANPLGAPKPVMKEKSVRKPGGQLNHPLHLKQLLARAENIWGPVYVDALVQRIINGTAYGVQQDANWNVTSMTKSVFNFTTGTYLAQIQETFVYDPYGKPTATPFLNMPYLFQGGRYDTTTGLYNFRNRDLSPSLGRWIEEDPVGYRGKDDDLYRFDSNHPTSGTDPQGQWLNYVFGFGVGCAAGTLGSLWSSWISGDNRCQATCKAIFSCVVGGVAGVISMAAPDLALCVSSAAASIINSAVSSGCDAYCNCKPPLGQFLCQISAAFLQGVLGCALNHRINLAAGEITKVEGAIINVDSQLWGGDLSAICGYLFR